MENTLITIKQLVSEAQCYEAIRTLRWQEKISDPHCNSEKIIKRGYHANQSYLEQWGK
jgi:flagellar biosynthesis regulator FlbT